MTITITECVNGYSVNVKKTSTAVEILSSIDFDKVVKSENPISEMSKVFSTLKDFAPKDETVICTNSVMVIEYVNGLLERPIPRSSISKAKSKAKRTK